MLFLPSLLLTTKLYRPPADANWVARPALFARLNEGLSCKLTLLSAPPGFGKTTLASQWLASCGRPSAWLAMASARAPRTARHRTLGKRAYASG